MNDGVDEGREKGPTLWKVGWEPKKLSVPAWNTS